jgi:predicted nucleotidyltransferase
VNAEHPLYNEINSIVKKYFGLDVIVEWIAKRLGNLRAVYLTGDIARGRDAGLIDLILVGDIDQKYLLTLIEKAEKLIKRKIRYLVYSEAEFSASNEKKSGALLVWGGSLAQS